MRNWKSTLFSILIALTLSCLGLGTSLWNVDSNVNPNTQKSFPLASNSNDKVAYFKDSKGATRSFTTIEGALNAAGKGNETDFANTIYVIPGTNPTINTDCTVASKDTLCIPYEGETYNGRQRNAEKGGTSNNSWKTPVEYTNGKISSGDYIANGSNPFADSNADYVAYFKKNEVTLNSKLIVSSGAFLQIGGILGWKDIGVTGQTSGKYCQITRGKGASIENSGTIDCRGYIKEANSTIETTILNRSGSVRKRPFVFYDYKGGSYTAAAYGGETKIFPLTRYDFPNVQSQLTFNHTSKLIGYVDLFTGTTSQKVTKLGITVTATIAARHNVDDLNVIGPGGEGKSYLFETLDSSASFIIKRKLTETRYTSYNASEHSPNYVTDFKANGNCKFNSTSISIQAGDDVSANAGGLLDISVFLNSVKDRLNQTIETSFVDFPLPWNFHIQVMNKGSLDISNSLKLMPGARLMVSYGASLKINGKVVIYDNSLNSGLFVDPGKIESQKLSTDYIYPNKGEAKLINNGTRTIASGASFGGKVSSEKEKAIIVVNEGAKLKGISCHEGIGKYWIDGLDIKFQFYDYPNSPVTKIASGVCYRNYYRTDLAPNFVCENRNEQALVAGETYTSYPLTAGSSSFGWHDSKGSHDKYGIKFDYTNENNETIDLKENPNSSVVYFENNEPEVVLSNPVPQGNYLFDGFYYDKNYTIPLNRSTDGKYIISSSTAIQHLSNKLLTIYSKWVKGGRIEIREYKGGSFISSNSFSLEQKSYSLKDLGINANDTRATYQVKEKCRTTYAFDKWILYKVSDSANKNNVLVDGSFIPETGCSYILEPVFKETYFLWMNISNDHWGKYYYIYNCSISDSNVIDNRFAVTTATDSKTATSFTAGWVSNQAKFSFTMENRYTGGPNHLQMMMNNNSVVKYDGNKSGLSSGQKSYDISFADDAFKNYFINGEGPITFKYSHG